VIVLKNVSDISIWRSRPVEDVAIDQADDRQL